MLTIINNILQSNIVILNTFFKYSASMNSLHLFRLNIGEQKHNKLFVTILVGKSLNRVVTWSGVGSIDKTFGFLFGYLYFIKLVLLYG